MSVIPANFRGSNDNGQADRKSSEYLAQLLTDKKALLAFPNVFQHLEKILDEEINRVRGNLFHLNTNKEYLQLPDPYGPVVTLTEKLPVPVTTYPDFNFVGRILGPRGMTAKQLEQETGCKIMVRGKGSMRDKTKEEQNRGKANWEHLNEELHVLISVEDTENRAEIKLGRAVEEVRKLLIPAAEGEDDLKKLQLMELAIINGTYRDNTVAVLTTQQGSRVITSPISIASMMRTPLTAGAPIFLAPRLQSPFGNVCTVSAGQQMLTGAPPPLMSSADGTSIIYQYNPFLQPTMLDYQAAYDQSSVGPMSKIRRSIAVREHPYTRSPLV